MLEIRRLPVGEYQSNCYLVVDAQTGEAVLIDAGDQAEEILRWVETVTVTRILISHGHDDHVGALEPMRRSLDTPVYIHPEDEKAYGLEADFALREGEVIPVGDDVLEIVHIPGHTPGSVAFKIVESGEFRRAIVGDAVFPGGPGHTESPSDLRLSLDSLARTVFTWPDYIELLPGHGDSTTVGAERSAFETFCEGPIPPDLSGDVSWR